MIQCQVFPYIKPSLNQKKPRFNETFSEKENKNMTRIHRQLERINDKMSI